MPSGGARARSGPAPDPRSLAALRPDHKANNLVTLPSSGRVGDPPTWPLPGESLRETEIWAELWRKPQAALWERDHLVEYVGLFARMLAEAEKHGASAVNRTNVRQMFADLYMTGDALFKAGYRIGEVEPVVKLRSFRQTSGKSHLAVVVPPGE